MKINIKEMNKDDLEEFIKVYRVFEGAPYFEKYEDSEIEDIFKDYLSKGFIYGVYLDKSCQGFIALEKGVKETQPVQFDDNKKVMYLGDIAVLKEKRNERLGSQLMLYGVLKSKEKGFDTLYMRTLKKGSMSVNIAKSLGFKEIEGTTQEVKRIRTNGNVETMDNIFLSIDLNSLNKDKFKNAITMTQNAELYLNGDERNDR